MQRSPWMYLAFFFQVLIAIEMAVAFSLHRYEAGILSLVMFLLTFLPYWIEKKLGFKFPWFVFFLITFTLWFNTAGYVQAYYLRFYPYFDKATHVVAGITVATVAFLGILFADGQFGMNLRKNFISGFIVIFTLAMAAAWEIYEFTVDTFFSGYLGGRMQVNNTDTMLDMIFTLAGAFIVAFIVTGWFRTHGKEDIMKAGIGPR